MYAKSCSAAAGDSSYSPWMIFKPISLFFPPKGREGPIAAAAPQQLAFILLQGKECRDALQGSRGWCSKDSKKTLEPEISWTRLIEKSFFSFVYLSLGSIFAYNHYLQVSSSNLASPKRPIPWRSYSQPLQTRPASLLLVIHNQATYLNPQISAILLCFFKAKHVFTCFEISDPTRTSCSCYFRM